MNILLCGANGFIGSNIRRALTQAGHTVVSGVSSARSPGSQQVVVDYARDTQAAAWLPRLQGIDAVINAVGVLRDTARRPINAVHTDTPKALFDACVQAGVRRVIQVSALGIEGNAQDDTRYASTKRAADQHLLALAAAGQLDATVLRPSIVFGKGGDSSALFVNLARLPVAVLPGPVIEARVQPVAVTDLAQAIAALLTPGPHPTGPIACVGPEALKLGDFIASLRSQLGHSPARVLRLPDVFTRLSARLGDAVSASPWSSEAVTLLEHDNVGDAAPFEALLGRKGVHFGKLIEAAWR